MTHSLRSRRLLASVCVLSLFVGTFLAGGAAGTEPAPNPFAKWEPAITAFEKHDAEHPPEPGGVLFVGSSSIRLWNLEESFPGLKGINRGFGGSQLVDSIHFADRIILPYKPRVVVIYAGDNDLNAGKSPERVAADYQQLAGLIRKGLPETKVVYIAVKPSIARWKLIDKVREANRLIRESQKGDALQAFVDIDAPMLGDDGLPRAELFVKDGLHLSPAGYAVWSELVRPHLP